MCPYFIRFMTASNYDLCGGVVRGASGWLNQIGCLFRLQRTITSLLMQIWSNMIHGNMEGCLDFYNELIKETTENVQFYLLR